MPATQQLLRILSGDARGVGPTLARAGLRLIEPFYAGAMRIRNVAFDRGWRRVHELPRPAVSVGNLTTGGTGKTPVVRWLVERLRDAGRKPAILMRGYKVGTSQHSDEQLMLEEQLHRGHGRRVIVHADPDRVAGARVVVRHDPEVDVFVLDDAFQHRRASRDFDLVLVNATNPFGYNHVLPRGLLREPMSGLKRADAVLVTRADLVDEEVIARIEQRIRRYHPHVPIYRSRHALTGILQESAQETGSRCEVQSPLDELGNRSIFAFGGIGDPQPLAEQLRKLAGTYAGDRWFGDHHDYSAEDLSALDAAARDAGADVLVTTEKDWAKLKHLDRASLRLPVARLTMAIRFFEDDEARLLQQIESALPVIPLTAA